MGRQARLRRERATAHYHAPMPWFVWLHVLLDVLTSAPLWRSVRRPEPKSVRNTRREERRKRERFTLTTMEAATIMTEDRWTR